MDHHREPEPDSDPRRPILAHLPRLTTFDGGRLSRFPSRRWGLLLAGVALLVLLLSSYYQVAPFEQGVVLRFGRYIGTVRQGPHVKLPFVDRVYKVPTERQLKEEFGFRTIEPAQRSTYQKGGFEAESLMLTGDLNIADVEFVVQYRIVDPYRYLFVLENPEQMVRAVAEAEMRGAVGDLGFDEVIKTRRNEAEEQVRRHMNSILALYRCGIDVKLVQLQDVHPPEPVKDSFEEVNRALQEMERSINEALQERNKILFRVEGEAKQRIAQAEGTRIERINRALGDAKRFDLLLAEYRKAPMVTRQRLYLEAMQEVLPATGHLVIVDDAVKGLLPLFNLQPPAAAGASGHKDREEPKP
ncbi:MAG TPA: FtsH protease activity modulator HflK [Thermoanaerobaculia bacterium]|nr:FtsH protease activity modulator HflK [Thermoanaerobaculia bacterium]